MNESRPAAPKAGDAEPEVPVDVDRLCGRCVRDERVVGQRRCLDQRGEDLERRHDDEHERQQRAKFRR